MKAEEVTVEVRNSVMVRTMAIPHRFILKSRFQPRHNDIGEWSITLPSDSIYAQELCKPGAGVVVSLDGEGELLSGPMLDHLRKESSSSPGEHVEITGACDNLTLDDRLCWPEPFSATPMSPSTSHYEVDGPAEWVMHDIVSANLLLEPTGIGYPEAVRGRRASGWRLGENLARGKHASVSLRFETVLEALQELATLYGVSFRAIQREDGVQFETYTGRDLSGEAPLMISNGTLERREVGVSAPGVTHAIVAGRGEDVSRWFDIYPSPEAEEHVSNWGRRVERFLDDRGTDDEEQHQEAAQELFELEATDEPSYQLVPGPQSQVAPLSGWWVGDTISANIDQASDRITAPVTSIIISIDVDGLKVGATVGDFSEFRRGGDVRRNVAEQGKRIAKLERTLETAVGAIPEIEDGILIPEPGWSLGTVQGIREGRYAQLLLNVTRTGAQINVPVHGDITNQVVARIVDPRYMPVLRVPATSHATGSVLAAWLQPNTGEIRVGAIAPGRNIATGNSLSFVTAAYLAAN